LFGKRQPVSGIESVQKTAPTTSPADLEKLKAKLIKLAAIEKSKKKALEESSKQLVQSTSTPPIGNIPTPPPMSDIPLPEPSSSVGSVQEPKVSGLLAEIQKGRALKKVVKKEVVVVVETDEDVRARAQSRLRKVGSGPVAPKSADEILAEKAENARKTEEALAKRIAATQKGIEQRAAAKERKRLEFIASGVLEAGASDEDVMKAIENETQTKNAEAIAQRNREEAARMKALADARKEREQPAAKKTLASAHMSIHTLSGIPTPPSVVAPEVAFDPDLIDGYSEAELKKYLAYFQSLGLMESEENEDASSQSEESDSGISNARQALMAEIRAVGKKKKEEEKERQVAVAKEKEALIETVAHDPNKVAEVLAEINKLDAENEGVLPIEKIKANPFSDSEVANLSNKQQAALYIQNLQTQTTEDVDYNNVKNPNAQSKIQMSALNSMLFDITNNLFINLSRV
jgi:hypothetical protein